MMRPTARSTSQQCCILLVATVLEVVALVHCNRIPWLWQWARVLNRYGMRMQFTSRCCCRQLARCPVSCHQSCASELVEHDLHCARLVGQVRSLKAALQAGGIKPKPAGVREGSMGCACEACAASKAMHRWRPALLLLGAQVAHQGRAADLGAAAQPNMAQQPPSQHTRLACG